MLQARGIGASVNLRDEFDDQDHELAMPSYYYLPVVDGEAPSLEQLSQGVAFIRQVVATGGKVYIHCHSGVGRAPTMAAAYLISQGNPVDEAIARIQQVRPFIDIKPGQREQLGRFEAMR